MIIDIIDGFSDLPNKIRYFLLSTFSSIARAFLDTIEKYLFEFNFLRPYTILFFEGLIGSLFNPILLLIDNYSYEDFKEIEYNKPLLIFLFIFFLISSSFKNIYRVLTIQTYSPMTRALAESILDPFILLYYCFLRRKKPKDSIYFGLIIFCLIITAFCSLVYNDFIVLYCCGMEKNTYLEINFRLKTESSIDFFDENDDDKDNNNDKMILMESKE